MKIVLNRCFGGFGLSLTAVQWMAERGSEIAKKELEYPRFYGHMSGIERHDPLLVECVESLGEEANGHYAALRVVDIDDDVSYHIDDYDGQETAHENHRSW